MCRQKMEYTIVVNEVFDYIPHGRGALLRKSKAEANGLRL